VGPGATEPGCTLATDTQRAEALLYDVAVLLRQVSLKEETRHMHLRALQLKREVGHWPIVQPAASEREVAIAELEALYVEAGSWLHPSRVAHGPEVRPPKALSADPTESQ
jgi:hypothetical protein